MTRAKIHLFLIRYNIRFLLGLTILLLFIFIPFPANKSTLELAGLAIAEFVTTFFTIAILWGYFIEHLCIVAPKLYKLGTLARIDDHTGIYTITEVYENSLTYYARGTGNYWYKAPRVVTHDDIHPLKPISRRR